MNSEYMPEFLEHNNTLKFIYNLNNNRTLIPFAWETIRTTNLEIYRRLDQRRIYLSDFVDDRRDPSLSNPDRSEIVSYAGAVAFTFMWIEDKYLDIPKPAPNINLQTALIPLEETPKGVGWLLEKIKAINPELEKDTKLMINNVIFYDRGIEWLVGVLDIATIYLKNT